jgi:hypothetical protein
VSEAATPPDPEIGEETAVERVLNRYLGHAMHLFLSLLGLLVLAAAGMATVIMLAHDFPKLWQHSDEYSSLQLILQNILLMAIAAELGLLLLFHRTSAAVEVVMFVIARKMVNPTISALELLLGAVGLAALIVVRFYYLPGRPR